MSFIQIKVKEKNLEMEYINFVHAKYGIHAHAKYGIQCTC